MSTNIEELRYWIITLTKRMILRKISLEDVTEEIMRFSDRYYLAEQLTADILFTGVGGGFNDIPKQLNCICASLS